MGIPVEDNGEGIAPDGRTLKAVCREVNGRRAAACFMKLHPLTEAQEKQLMSVILDHSEKT